MFHERLFEKKKIAWLYSFNGTEPNLNRCNKRKICKQSKKEKEEEKQRWRSRETERERKRRGTYWLM